MSHKNGATENGRMTPEYSAWAEMRKRCRNPRSKAYRYYGGRGISICERWESFANFLADMGRKPSADLSLDRIDVDGDYAPDNCRWATRVEQARNKRTAKLTVAIAAQIKAMDSVGVARAEIARRLGVSSASVSNVALGKQWRDVLWEGV